VSGIEIWIRVDKKFSDLDLREFTYIQWLSVWDWDLKENILHNNITSVVLVASHIVAFSTSWGFSVWNSCRVPENSYRYCTVRVDYLCDFIKMCRDILDRLLKIYTGSFDKNHLSCLGKVLLTSKNYL